MKNKWWKRAAALGLAASMALGLSACGGDKNTNSALAKEGVSTFQELTLPDMEADYMNVSGTGHKDGRVYVIMQLEHWNSDSQEMDIRVVSMKEDGSDVQVVKLDIPKQDSASGGSGGGAIPRAAASSTMPAVPETEDEEQEDVDTEDTDTEDTDPESADSAVDMPADGDMGENYWENTYYGDFQLAPDGSIFGIKTYNYESYGEEYYSIQKHYFCKWSSQDGSLLGETELVLKDPDKEDEWVGINTMTMAEDGSLHMILYGETPKVLSLDAEGKSSGKKDLPEDAKDMFNYTDRIIPKSDGTFLVLYYGEDWEKEYMASYDPATNMVGESRPLPDFMAGKGFNFIMEGITYDLVYSDSNGIYSFNIGDQSPTLRMSFVNSDLDISYFNGLVELNDDTFIGIFNDNYKDEMKLGVFTHVNPEDIPDKSVLVLAGNYIPYDMKHRVVEFNRSSQEYRIVLRDYQQYNTYDDWNASVTQLNNDIITGNMPDILVCSGLPVQNYASRGLLADIGKMIQEDEELSKIEFVQNVFDAYSVDGVLHYVIPSFNVQTMMAKTSLVGDRTEWTMEDAKNVLASMPEGAKLFGDLTRDSYFSTAMAYCLGDFMDTTTGKCDFNSERFISMMEYAKSLPESMEEEYGEDYWIKYQSQYRENRTLLMQVYIYSIRDLNYNINGRMGEDVSYVGFPMEGGQGALINANQLYAISDRSSFKEGAWQFLRNYLTDEYQSENTEWYLSVHMNRFKENANKAMEKPYWIDEETGEKHEYEDTFYLNGESIPLPQMSQAQVDKVVNYILSLKNCSYDNTSVINIINEEMGGYFSGQQSAQAVAGVIQNRVQLYVDENR